MIGTSGIDPLRTFRCWRRMHDCNATVLGSTMFNSRRIATLAAATLALLGAFLGAPRLAHPELARPELAAGGCVGSDAGSASPEAREVSCLRELAVRASRAGNVLTLRLNDGSAKSFRSNPEACRNDAADKCVTYRLVGFHAAAQRYLVHVARYEGVECRLVSARTGRATTLLDVPHFAPDGSTFVVTGFDYAFNSWITIGSVASDPPALSWKSDPLREEWMFVRWIDNDEVAVRNTLKSASCPDGACDAILRRSGTSWTLIGPPATGR